MLYGHYKIIVYSRFREFLLEIFNNSLSFYQRIDPQPPYMKILPRFNLHPLYHLQWYKKTKYLIYVYNTI